MPPRPSNRASGARVSRVAAACLALGSVGAAAGAPPVLRAQQPLETETARSPRRGETVVSLTYECQTSGQGQQHALPFAVEYGLTTRLTARVEPVFYTAIRPRGGTPATGLGDVEATLQWLALPATRVRPAVALAAEAKIPTATDRQIGTGKADVTLYLIASKGVGAFDGHVNGGHSFVGKPAGLAVQNTLNLAVALEAHLSPRVEWQRGALDVSRRGCGRW